MGGTETPYEGGVFSLEIKIPERYISHERIYQWPDTSCYCLQVQLTRCFLHSRYPFEPPKIRFLTPIYHPNIDSSGRICHDALKLPPKVVRDSIHKTNYFLLHHHYLFLSAIIEMSTQTYLSDHHSGCLEAIFEYLHSPYFHSAAYGWAQSRWPTYGWYSESHVSHLFSTSCIILSLWLT